MGGILASPKTGRAPFMPVPEPEAIPVPGKKAPEIAKRRRRRGRGETILTGELEPVTTKKTLLGGQ